MSESRRKDAEAMKLIICFLISIFSSAIYAQVQFDSGNKLKENCESAQGTYRNALCMGYIIGVADANATSICSPLGVTKGQYESIVKKYLNDNPALLHKDADILVMGALSLAFPCPRKK